MTSFINNEAVVALELVELGYERKENTFKYVSGSVSNGVSIFVKFIRFKEERYNVDEDRFYYIDKSYAHITIKKWVYDGNDVEYTNNFDVTVEIDRVISTIDTLVLL
jgi:hypothetical protein